MKSKNGKKSWGAMSAAELAEATREFDHPLPESRYTPLSKAERARFERARNAGKHGRELMKALNIDPTLLSEAAAYARRRKLTLSQILERGLRRELAVKD
jgi:hypothetical protein